MVRYTGQADTARIESQYALRFVKVIPGSLIRVYSVSGKDPVGALLERLRREPGVELAEEDHRMEAQ